MSREIARIYTRVLLFRERVLAEAKVHVERRFVSELVRDMRYLQSGWASLGWGLLLTFRSEAFFSPGVTLSSRCDVH